MRVLFLLILVFATNRSIAQTHDSVQVFRCFAGEEMPEFPGGQEKLVLYLSENIHYPETAKVVSTEGRCTLRFVVDEAGCISNIQVIRSAGRGMDTVIINAVSRMPCWTPGKRNGIPAKTIFFLPVNIHWE
jgi:TonB family protein